MQASLRFARNLARAFRRRWAFLLSCWQAVWVPRNRQIILPRCVRRGYPCLDVEHQSVPPSQLSLLRSLKPLSVADVIVFVQQFTRAGHWETARRLCEQAMSHWGADTALCVTWALVELGAGQRSVAEELLESVLAAHPEHLSALYVTAWMKIEHGRLDEAREQLLAIIDIFADYPGALGTLATLLMPGPSYRDVLAFLHSAIRPRTYLEIADETGETLELAKDCPVVIGVDPDLSSLEQDRRRESARLYACTSDEFFARESAKSVLHDQPLDFAFIEGIHPFEFTLRDFCNVETWSNRQTVVALQNVLPILPVVAQPQRETGFWVGDTWKALFVLLDLRDDLTIHVIPTAPSGVAVIRNLDAQRSLTEDQLTMAIRRFSALPYPEGEAGHWPSRIPIVENSVAGWHTALGTREGAA